MIHAATGVADDSEEGEQDDEGERETDDIMEEELDLPSSFVNDEHTKTRKETSGTVILRRQNHVSNSRNECSVFYFWR